MGCRLLYSMDCDQPGCSVTALDSGMPKGWGAVTVEEGTDEAPAGGTDVVFMTVDEKAKYYCPAHYPAVKAALAGVG